MFGVTTMVQSATRALKLGAPAMLALTFAMPATISRVYSRPYLPPGCEELDVPLDQDVSFHVFADGVQIYRWDDPTGTWIFVAPEATLYAASNHRGLVGSHFAGPTWETDSGSFVVGAKLVGCTPDVTAIPWLKLAGVNSDGPGPFDHTTFIQRVETAGGLAPSRSGTTGEIARVPYTAEYYFYRQN